MEKKFISWDDRVRAAADECSALSPEHFEEIIRKHLPGPEKIDFLQLRNHQKPDVGFSLTDIVFIRAMCIYCEKEGKKISEIPEWTGNRPELLEVALFINSIRVPFFEAMESLTASREQVAGEMGKKILDDWFSEEQNKLSDSFSKLNEVIKDAYKQVAAKHGIEVDNDN